MKFISLVFLFALICHFKSNKVPSKVNDSRPKNVYVPKYFTMNWNYYHVYNNDQEDENPPYPNGVPTKSNYIIGPGITYSDSSFRGGSQVEIYYERCIPIFPVLSNEFSCTFININDEKKGYVVAKNPPSDFPKCCIIQQPFAKPKDDFSDLMNYEGVKIYPNINREYLSFKVDMPDIGGEFEYSFWNKALLDENNNTFYEPSFFKFKGINDHWIFQRFYNFLLKRPDSAIFDVPDICKVPELPFCPGFN